MPRFIQAVLVTTSSLPAEELIAPYAGASEVVFIEEEEDPFNLTHPVAHESMAEYARDWL